MFRSGPCCQPLCMERNVSEVLPGTSILPVLVVHSANRRKCQLSTVNPRCTSATYCKCTVPQVSSSTVLAYLHVQFLLSKQNPRVKFCKIFLKSNSLHDDRHYYSSSVSSLHLVFFASLKWELTNPWSKSRAHRCPLKAFMSLSILLYNSSCFSV
jgi:hypothetical protein